MAGVRGVFEGYVGSYVGERDGLKFSREGALDMVLGQTSKVNPHSTASRIGRRLRRRRATRGPGQSLGDQNSGFWRW